ncbi:MAG: PDDEXK nuclease domain-containing protein [Candidatus Electrothrix aestuarii]|uniref:PDDEXK nuclease domain-containing protein n=1 Tax=Candidatus Electrothrix aestuarii TaxID=3062594 RepID=A0AAU8LPE1_9BACT|nr:PDDEXK nuclease domain-containing protein [Candidatus Electrothrix aestuarii]
MPKNDRIEQTPGTSLSPLLSDIRKIVAQARNQAYSAVNTAMVQAYWLIGKRIVEEEQNGQERAQYGRKIIKTLSKELTAEFGKGFSERTIREFRQFYIIFQQAEIRRTLCANSSSLTDQIMQPEMNDEIWHTLFTRLSWSHIRLIMRLSNTEARAYYIKETAENNWSVRTLDRNISTLYYERLLKSPNQEPVKQEMLEKTEMLQRDKFEFIKNPAVLEFLNLPANRGYTEQQLEQALLDNLQQFLLELGKGYAFVERQKLIRTEARDYYIDLVFYNYILKCFVLIDLKTHRITHQDVGQMDMYVRMFDNRERCQGDNPTLGIVLCTETDQDIARYSVLKGNEQLFASKYKLYLPTEEELRAEIEREKLHLRLQMEQNSPA